MIYSNSAGKNNALPKQSIEAKSFPFSPSEKTSFTFIDLFAGIGGFRMAMQSAGGSCVYSSEWDKAAKTTYFTNFGEMPLGDIMLQDVKDSIPAKFDVLCAGFPCQAFSIAGLQKGFSDSRGQLFFEIKKIIEKHRPKAVVLENVKNLVKHDKGRSFKTILDILEGHLGYKVFYKILNTMTHCNIPQNRERIFIVCFDPLQVANYFGFKFPKKIPLTKTVADFLETERQPECYYYSPKSSIYTKLEKNVTQNTTVYQWRRTYVRENKNSVCPALTANMGTGGHNVPIIKDSYGIRKLTLRECFALQGFPVDQFIFPEISKSSLYKQIGNSVTLGLVQKIAAETAAILKSS
ncbi:DNA (cytosine-5-)-methyltransferase [Flavobacterium collinsii]|nr:DNA (cytosine-5-)-methyltransferase [Flavobacterium collinsii]